MNKLKTLYPQLCKKGLLTPAQINKADEVMRARKLSFDALLSDGSIELIDRDREILVYVDRDGSVSKA